MVQERNNGGGDSSEKKRNELIKEMFWRGKRLGCLSDTWPSVAWDDTDGYRELAERSRWCVCACCVWSTRDSTNDAFQLDVLNAGSLQDRLALFWSFKSYCMQ